MTRTHRFLLVLIIGLCGRILSFALHREEALSTGPRCPVPIGLQQDSGPPLVRCFSSAPQPLQALISGKVPASIRRDTPLQAGDLLRRSVKQRWRVERLGAGRRLMLGLRLDIERAGIDALRMLPRIGPKLAARIVASRKRDGAFRSVEALRRVRGIGRRTLDTLRPLICAGCAPPRAPLRQGSPSAPAATTGSRWRGAD